MKVRGFGKEMLIITINVSLQTLTWLWQQNSYGAKHDRCQTLINGIVSKY